MTVYTICSQIGNYSTSSKLVNEIKVLISPDTMYFHCISNDEMHVTDGTEGQMTLLIMIFIQMEMAKVALQLQKNQMVCHQIMLLCQNQKASHAVSNWTEAQMRHLQAYANIRHAKPQITRCASFHFGNFFKNSIDKQLNYVTSVDYCFMFFILGTKEEYIIHVSIQMCLAREEQFPGVVLHQIHKEIM